MAEVAAGVAIAGTVMSIYGQREASKAQESANRAMAEAKRIQAFELLERFEMNAEAHRTSAHRFEQIQQAQYAKGGVDIGTGSPLVAQAETMVLVDRQIEIERMEAESKANALMRGADVDISLAGDIAAARPYQMAGMFMQGMSSAASTYTTMGGGKSGNKGYKHYQDH